MTARYESLQDKLAQLKDARDALDVLREEHKEKRRRQQEEMERLRQIQLAQKLEVLRQQKQVSWVVLMVDFVDQMQYKIYVIRLFLIFCWKNSAFIKFHVAFKLRSWNWRQAAFISWIDLLQVYLEYQRQMALQRMQEQEMEMRKRLEMQKQEQQMKAMQYGYPQVSLSPWIFNVLRNSYHGAMLFSLNLLKPLLGILTDLAFWSLPSPASGLCPCQSNSNPSHSAGHLLSICSRTWSGSTTFHQCTPSQPTTPWFGPFPTAPASHLSAATCLSDSPDRNSPARSTSLHNGWR